MKNISTGTGLALLSAAILGSTMIMRFGPADQAAHAAPPMEAAKAIAAASTAQVTPTIVWYGVAPPGTSAGAAIKGAVFRAWSDGKIEFKQYFPAFNYGCSTDLSCDWQVFSTPNQGYNAASDINFDEKVDGADLGQVLAMWGNAPRQDIPPSTCPLNLINP
jgi:hypothetical protein